MSTLVQLDTFRRVYNEERPHRAIGRRTPAAAYAARVKAHPAGRGMPAHFRLRDDTTDGKGALTLRRGGRTHHLKVGAAHARKRVLAIVDEQEVTVVALDTGEVLSVHRIEPGKGYWRNQRPADTGVAYVATQDMARPTGIEMTRTHSGKSIPIEGADEWEVATMSSA